MLLLRTVLVPVLNGSDFPVIFVVMEFGCFLILSGLNFAACILHRMLTGSCF